MAGLSPYQASLSAFKDAKQKLRDAVEHARAVMSVFEGWEKKQPRDLNGTLTAAMQRWPAGKTLTDAVDGWKAAWDRVHEEWRSLPEAEKIGLLPPQQFDAD